jgi:hypothetical protein
MKTIPAVKRFLGLPAVTKSQSGFLIALVVIITIVGKVAIENLDVLSRNKTVVCIVIGIAGFVSWLGGRLCQGKRVGPSQDPAATVDPDMLENPLAFFTSAQCWGMILVVSAAILSYITVTHGAPAAVLTVHARAQPKVLITITNAVTVTNETCKVSFPPLALQGIVINGAKSSAVINGRVLYIGEQIRNVVLMAVTPAYVTVGLEGQTKWLVLQ